MEFHLLDYFFMILPAILLLSEFFRLFSDYNGFSGTFLTCLLSLVMLYLNYIYWQGLPHMRILYQKDVF